MRVLPAVLSAAVLALGVGPAPAAEMPDLSQVDRALQKEPAYAGKKPLYGLAVFGPKADKKVWLVLDKSKPEEHWREELPGNAVPGASDRPVRGLFPKGEARKDVAMVFVLDRQKKPLMPCTPKRARLLFAASQLSPWFGDWLLRRMTSG